MLKKMILSQKQSSKEKVLAELLLLLERKKSLLMFPVHRLPKLINNSLLKRKR